MPMYQVDSEDANFLFLEQAESPTHISLIALYDPSDRGDEPVRFSDIRAQVDGWLNAAPVFRQKIQRAPGDIDYPYWVDDHRFDLDFHLRHLALPRPGDWRQFCIQVSRLHSRPLDMSRPLWELYVIEGLDRLDELPSGCFALYFKIHHCAMDEFTAQELFQALNTHRADRSLEPAATQRIAHLPSVAPPPLEMVLRGLVNNSVRSLRLLAQSASNLPTLSRVATRLSLRALQARVDGGDGEEPGGSRFARPLSAARVFEGGFYPRDLVEDYAATVPGASWTHAILAICGEATRAYLEHHGELEEEALYALLQLNLRNAGAHAMVGNRLALNQVGLAVDVEFPAGRLQAIHALAGELGSIEEAELTSFRLRSLYENLPAPVLAWLGRGANRRNSLTRRIMEGGHFGLATLRGADQTLYLQGARLAGTTAISPLYSGCGLMFNANLQSDVVGITFTSDRHMLPDPELLRQCLDQSMQTLAHYLRRGAA